MKYKKLEECNYIENKGDILACKYYHLLFPDGNEAIGSPGIKEIDNKGWEIFWVSKETENAYYGSPAEGLGLADCMILKTDTRAFLPEEIEELEKHTYGLTGLLNEEVKYTYPVKINPIVEKWNAELKPTLKEKYPIYFKIVKSIIKKYNGEELKEILHFLEHLRDNSLLLKCLEEEGVEGWSGYDWAIDKQRQIDEKNGYDLTYNMVKEIKQGLLNNKKMNVNTSQDIERKLKIKDEYLSLIVGIGFDYDGYYKATDLKGVIDELVKYAKKALNNDDSSIIYSGTNKKYNILNEELEGKNDN